MKKIFCIAVFSLLLTMMLEAKQIEGIIIYPEDTVKVTFNIPLQLFTQDIIFQNLQKNIMYIDSTTGRNHVPADKVVEIQFRHQGSTVRMVSVKRASWMKEFSWNTRKYIFLHLKEDGNVRLYKYYYLKKSPQNSNGQANIPKQVKIPNEELTTSYIIKEKHILQKVDGPLKSPKTFKFRVDMIEYFNDCPFIGEKLKNKEFGRKDIELIVRIYNTKCK